MNKYRVIKRALYAVAGVLFLTSCAQSYNIQGTSNVAMLDGHRLYLKIVKDESLANLDSCEVVHGQFTMAGNVDSTCMANLYMDEESLLPLVLESGNITIRIDNTQRTLGGTPLNDKLYEFLKSLEQLQSEQIDLVHKHDQAIMNGSDMDVVTRELIAQDEVINGKMDKLVTRFVTENFDNVLGPGAFMMMTSGYEVPMLTPWIEDILSKASEKFKNDPYVKEYVEAANRNQSIMNGMADTTPMAPPPAPGTMLGAPIAPPTPAEMAGDTIAKK